MPDDLLHAAAGWNWHGSGTGANRLGCSVSGSYWDNAVPAGIWQFGPVALKPAGNPHEAFALGHRPLERDLMQDGRTWGLSPWEQSP